MKKGRGNTSTAANHLTSESGPHGFPSGGPESFHLYDPSVKKAGAKENITAIVCMGNIVSKRNL